MRRRTNPFESKVLRLGAQRRRHDPIRRALSTNCYIRTQQHVSAQLQLPNAGDTRWRFEIHNGIKEGAAARSKVRSVDGHWSSRRSEVRVPY